MLLNPGERQLGRGQAQLVDDNRTVTMTLTNQRFVVEADDPDGIMDSLLGGARTAILLDAPLSEVSNAQASRRLIGRPRLHVDTKRGILSVKAEDAAAWAGAIAHAKAAMPHPPGPVPPVQVHTIERQVVKVRCRHCGRLVDEVAGRCPSCGAPL